MIVLNLDPETRKIFDRENRIKSLDNYFTFGTESPEEVLCSKPYLASRAVELLDRIQEITGLEYSFLHIQGGPLGGSHCIPWPKEYRPKNKTQFVLGSYDKAYFQEFIRKYSA